MDFAIWDPYLGELAVVHLSPSSTLASEVAATQALHRLLHPTLALLSARLAELRPILDFAFVAYQGQVPSVSVAVEATMQSLLR